MFLSIETTNSDIIKTVVAAIEFAPKVNNSLGRKKEKRWLKIL